MSIILQSVTYFLVPFIGFFLPWYATPIICILVSYLFGSSPFKSFGLAALFTALNWVVMAYLLNSKSNVSVSQLLSDLFGKVGELPIFIITALTIGLICGISAMIGSMLKQMKYH